MTSDKQPTAVVIDDDAASAWGLALLLHDNGFRTISGRDFDSVQQRLDEEGLKPDVAVCDFHLEDDENGVVAATRLQEHFGAKIPALIVSGSAGESPYRLAFREGFSVLAKPVDPDLLIRHIQRLFCGATSAAAC